MEDNLNVLTDTQDENVEVQANEEAVEGGSESNSSETNQKPEQSKEENNTAKAIRLERERLNAEKQLFEKNKSITQKYGKDYEVFSEEDISAKYGQSGIHTLEQFEKALLEDQYRQAGIDPGMINKAIESHPVMKQAAKLIEENRSKEIDSIANKQFEELQHDFPESGIKTFEDLAKMPTYNDFLNKLRLGYTMADAYESVNRSALRKSQSQLTDKERQLIEKRTIANIADRKSRGLISSSDGEPEHDIELTPQGSKMAVAFGNDPKDIAKYVKKQIKR